MSVRGSGRQNTLVCGFGSGAAVRGSGNGTGLGVGVAVTGYVLAPALVHWANGQVGPGFGSMSLRVGAPVVLGAWGS